MGQKTVFTCPKCSHQASVPDTVLGKQARCPGCNETVLITAASLALPSGADQEAVHVPANQDPLGPTLNDPLGIGQSDTEAEEDQEQSDQQQPMPDIGGLAVAGSSNISDILDETLTSTDTMSQFQGPPKPVYTGEMAHLQRELKELRKSTANDSVLGFDLGVTQARTTAVSHNINQIGSALAGARDDQLQDSFDRTSAEMGAYEGVAKHTQKKIKEGLRRQGALEWLANEKRGFPNFAARWGVAFPMLGLLLVINLLAVGISFASPVGGIVLAVLAGIVLVVIILVLRPLSNAIRSYPTIRNVGPGSPRASSTYLPFCAGLCLLSLGCLVFLVFKAV